MTAVDQTLAALADPTRRQVIDLLRQHPRKVGDLATQIGVSAPLMSRHLRTLRLHGLVEEGRQNPLDSRIRTYSLRREPFEELRQWLQQVESFWTEQLDSFRNEVERSQGAK